MRLRKVRGFWLYEEWIVLAEPNGNDEFHSFTASRKKTENPISMWFFFHSMCREEVQCFASNQDYFLLKPLKFWHHERKKYCLLLVSLSRLTTLDPTSNVIVVERKLETREKREKTWKENISLIASRRKCIKKFN